MRRDTSRLKEHQLLGKKRTAYITILPTLTNCALSKIASTTPARKALQFNCDSSLGTEIYFVRTGSLSDIMTGREKIRPCSDLSEVLTL
jgi:hypothetical protein